jgi:2-dehydro-3-deoxyphosphogluconate aldolase / (4S)-4-hydroxy-2-oxoglutarate aldolase
MLNTPVLAILRGVEHKHLAKLVQVFKKVAIDTVEITMNTPGATELIEEFRRLSGDNMIIGAGTVLNTSQLDKALAAGARFIVTPVVSIDVISRCTEMEIPVFPGALTPTEVWQAWSAGATMVKVFPAGVFGPNYFKELKGPLDSLKLMAVGGVKANNVKAYFDAGASAVAVGGSIFGKERLEMESYTLMEQDLLNILHNLS